MDLWRDDLHRDGFAIIPGVFAAEQADSVVQDLNQVLDRLSDQEGAVRGAEGTTYAARNLLQTWPAAALVWRQRPLPEIVRNILGPCCGLVRVLFFDKPPVRTWCLPWHKDMTIAVQDHDKPSSVFHKPTRKAGVPHVEAPQTILEAMLTVRVHLDEVTEANGPLRVLPGSHLTGLSLQIDETKARSILVRGGDVLLMRPLLAHSSRSSCSGTTRHRRILHYEFAADGKLPDGYAWHDFLPV